MTCISSLENGMWTWFTGKRCWVIFLNKHITWNYILLDCPTRKQVSLILDRKSDVAAIPKKKESNIWDYSVPVMLSRHIQAPQNFTPIHPIQKMSTLFDGISLIKGDRSFQFQFWCFGGMQFISVTYSQTSIYVWQSKWTFILCLRTKMDNF